jgi:hypothetical protein
VELKHRIHQFLSLDPDLKEWVEGEAIGTSHPPSDLTQLAWREGRRSFAVEIISLYREVENERNRNS